MFRKNERAAARARRRTRTSSRPRCSSACSATTRRWRTSTPWSRARPSWPRPTACADSCARASGQYEDAIAGSRPLPGALRRSLRAPDVQRPSSCAPRPRSSWPRRAERPSSDAARGIVARPRGISGARSSRARLQGSPPRAGPSTSGALPVARSSPAAVRAASSHTRVSSSSGLRARMARSMSAASRSVHAVELEQHVARAHAQEVRVGLGVAALHEQPLGLQ